MPSAYTVISVVPVDNLAEIDNVAIPSAPFAILASIKFLSYPSFNKIVLLVASSGVTLNLTSAVLCAFSGSWLISRVTVSSPAVMPSTFITLSTTVTTAFAEKPPSTVLTSTSVSPALKASIVPSSEIFAILSS